MSNKKTITLGHYVGHDKVRFDQENENHILLELTGNEVDIDKQRSPLSIVALLDCSSSMSPDYKIGYLKKSMVKLIDNLRADDQLCMISYQSSARMELNLTNMTTESKKSAVQIVNGLAAGGCTNISAALGMAFDELNNLADGVSETGRVVRTILFTDGCPTSGNCNQDDLVKMAATVPVGQVTTMGYGREVTVNQPNVSQNTIPLNNANSPDLHMQCWNSGGTTYTDTTSAGPNRQSVTPWMSGFNGMSGGVDIPLLQSMCQAGKGNFYYMKDPDSCVRAFAYELAGLLTTVGQNIKITVEPTQHLTIDEIMDDVDVEEKDGKAVISITDVMAEEKKYVALKIKTTKQDKAFPRATTVAKITVEYKNQEGEAVTDELSVKLKFVKAGEESTEQHKEVKAHLALIDVIRAQAKVELDSLNGIFGGASYYAYHSAVDNLSSDALEGTHAAGFAGMHVSNVRNYVNVSNFSSSVADRCGTQYSTAKGRSAGDNLKGTKGQAGMHLSFSADIDTPAEPPTQTPDATPTAKSSYVKKSRTDRF